mgnify:CR=1 FL=1
MKLISGGNYDPENNQVYTVYRMKVDDAAAYANQSTGVVPEAQKYNFMPGERRGDPTDDDNYATLSLTYSRYLLGQNKYYRNASRWRTKNYYSPRGFKRSKSRIIRSKF